MTSNVNWATIIPLIGGSAIGCSQATGNKPLYHLSYTAFNANEKHIEKYWPDVPRILLDRGQSIPDQPLDFVNSVCPCAGLSQLNSSKDQKVRDERNKWMFESAETVLGSVKPKVFFGENAPGLYSNSGKYVMDSLLDIGKKHGYSFSLYKTSTHLHGIPQKRIRTFYFFWRDRNAPILSRFSRPTKAFYEYIQDIPKSAENQDQFPLKGGIEGFKSYEFLLRKLNTTHQEFVKLHDDSSVHSVHTYIQESGFLEECIYWLKENYPESKEIGRLTSILEKTNSGGRFMDSSPGFHYLRTNAIVGRALTNLMHPIEERGLSVREILHLMGLPHDFPFTGNPNDINHIAQNVPTCTAKDMASEVIRFLNGELEDSGRSFMKQCNITGEVEF